MLIVSALLSRIGALTGTGTPEPGDNARILPNVYTGPLPFPLDVNGNLGGQIYSDSFQISNGETITNTGGGLATSLCFLEPGIWRLAFTVDMEFNWLNANPLATDARLVLRASSLPINLSLAFSAARNSRTIIRGENLEIALKDRGQLLSILNGNGVGQTSTINYTISGTRFL